MSEADQLFHKSFKPHWGTRTTLLYAMPTTFNSSTSNPNHSKSILYHSKGTFVSEGRDVRFAKFMPASTVSCFLLWRYCYTEARDHSSLQQGLLNSVLPPESESRMASRLPNLCSLPSKRWPRAFRTKPAMKFLSGNLRLYYSTNPYLLQLTTNFPMTILQTTIVHAKTV